MNAGSDQIKQMDTFGQYTTYLLVSYVVYASATFYVDLATRKNDLFLMIWMIFNSYNTSLYQIIESRTIPRSYEYRFGKKIVSF